MRGPCFSTWFQIAPLTNGLDLIVFAFSIWKEVFEICPVASGFVKAASLGFLV